MKVKAWAFGINPEPWATGVSVARVNRKTGKPYVQVSDNGTLKLYQEGLRDFLRQAMAEMQLPNYSIRIWFQRQTVNYLANAGGRGNRNEADGTNILKATEDALQTLVIDNDRNCLHGEWIMMAQDREVEPLLVIELGYDIADWQDSFFPSQQYTAEAIDAIASMYKAESEASVITGNELEV